MAPGCPLAVDIMMLLTHAWVQAARRVSPMAEVRDYTDDLASWVSGSLGEVVAAVCAQERLMADLSEVANCIRRGI